MADVVKVVMTGARGPGGAMGKPGTVADASGFLGAVAIPNSGLRPHTVRGSDATAVTRVDTREEYAGTGTATSGAPRYYDGTLAPSGDDSAHCTGRQIVGDDLFSHRDRDESAFRSNGDSAYTTSDSAPTYQTNSGAKYNHGYGFQWRATMAAANGMDLFAGFVSYPRVTAGTVDRLFHFHAQGLVRSGSGAVVQQHGFHVDALGPGAFGVFVEHNDSYMGGGLQIKGPLNGVTTLDATGEAKAMAAHATGGIASFAPGGGLVMAQASGPAGYRTLRAYQDGTGAPAGLSILSNNLLLGGAVPVTGAAIEMFGTATPSTDNAFNLGAASFRFATIFAGTGTINTSDERLKKHIGDIPDAWLDAWGCVQWQRFRFKGGDRWHIGLIAQRVHQAFADAGEDAFAIGLCCYDKWDEQRQPVYAMVERTREVEREVPVTTVKKVPRRERIGKRWRTVMDEVTSATMEVRTVTETYEVSEPTGDETVTLEAGDRWGLRYDECFAMEAAYQRREMARLRASVGLSDQ